MHLNPVAWLPHVLVLLLLQLIGAGVVGRVRRERRLDLPPPLCARIAQRETPGTALFQSALPDYGGNDWLRSVFWLKGSYFLIVDQVNAGARLSSVSCQWNMLGEVQPGEGFQRVVQRGAALFLHWLQPAGLRVRRGTYVNLSLEAELAADHYPYAEPPVKKVDLVRGPKQTRHQAIESEPIRDGYPAPCRTGLPSDCFRFFSC